MPPPQPRCSSPSRHRSRRHPGPEAAFIAAPGTHRGARAPLAQKHTSREGRGVVPRESGAPWLGPPARSPKEMGPGRRTCPGKFGAAPPASAERTRARSLRAVWPPELVYFRGYAAQPRRSSEAERPREGVPATPAAPPPPTGSPAVQPASRPPRPCPQQAQSRAGDPLAGSEERRRAPDRAPGLPRSAAAWHLAPWPRSEQPGPRQLPPSRGVSAARVSRVHIAAHPQRRSWLAPGRPRRRLTASPLSWARVAKPGVPAS